LNLELISPLPLVQRQGGRTCFSREGRKSRAHLWAFSQALFFRLPDPRERKLLGTRKYSSRRSVPSLHALSRRKIRRKMRRKERKNGKVGNGGRRLELSTFSTVGLALFPHGIRPSKRAFASSSSSLQTPINSTHFPFSPFSLSLPRHLHPKMSDFETEKEQPAQAYNSVDERRRAALREIDEAKFS